MTSYENNKKYIAEAWINNEEDEELKTSFLQALIQQIQGHGNGFDADTVDGMHKEDIEQLVIESTKDFITEFRIGNTEFRKHTGEDIYTYYLGFEAIKLYDVNSEETPEEDKVLPWTTEPYGPDEIPNLLETIRTLYNRTYMGDPANSNQTNRSIYLAFKTQMETLQQIVENFQEVLEGKITEDGLLNADCVNGFRFFIYTPDEYQDLKDEAALYDPSYEEDIDNRPENLEQIRNSYKKLNSIHNIFIIKTQEELARSGYPNGYDGNPDTAVIDKYYQFRVAPVTIDDTTQKYLQYKYQNENEWHNLCPTADFLDSEAMTDMLIDILNNNSEYKLSPDVVKEALTHIIVTDENVTTNSNNNSNSIPWIEYNKEKYLAGGLYTINNTDTQLPTKNKNGFKYLDLTPLKNILDESIDDVNDDLNDYKVHLEGDGQNNKGIIGDLQVAVNRNNFETEDLKTTFLARNREVGEALTRLHNEDDELRDYIDSQIASVTKWEQAVVWTKSNGQSIGDLMVNKSLKLARLKIYNAAIYDNSEKGWKKLCFVDSGSNPKQYITNGEPENGRPFVPEIYTPSGNVHFATNNPNVTVRLGGTSHNSGDDNYQQRIQYRTSNIDVKTEYEGKDRNQGKYIIISFDGVYTY